MSLMYLLSNFFTLLTPTILLPNLSLALEFQGNHHYVTHFFGDVSVRQRRDQAKVKFASQFGITVISIPFWWDKSPSSLASTIQYYRPDINIPGKEVPPIPLQMPARFKERRA
jgi:hypothetical protein